MISVHMLKSNLFTPQETYGLSWTASRDTQNGFRAFRAYTLKKNAPKFGNKFGKYG